MSTATYDFQGRVAMITGANGNLGSALAQAYAQAGADLILVGRSKERVEEALPDLIMRDSVFVAPGTDLTDADAVGKMVQAAMAHFGRIDILANSVGGYRSSGLVHETAPDSWDGMIALNLRTAFVVSRAVIPPMLEAGYGKIVHTASRAALNGSRRAAGYGAAKAGLVNLTDTLALELKGKGINVNCVLPGTIDTPENREAMPSADHNKWVAPEAIARIFLFLSSEDATPLHGAHIPAYGLS